MASPDTNSVLSGLSNIKLDADDALLQDQPQESSLISPSFKCGTCREGASATSHCQVCNESLCDSCVSAHLRVRLTKDHIIFRLKNDSPNHSSTPNQLFATPGTSLNGTLYCERHLNEIMKFYCDNCLMPICRDCFKNEHNGHSITDLQDAIEGSRMANFKLLTDSKASAHVVSDSIGITQQMLDLVNVKANLMNIEIQSSAMRLQEAIKEREFQLIYNVERIRLAKVQVLAQQLNSLQQEFNRFNHMSNHLTETLELGSPIDQLQAYKNLGFLRAVNVSLQPQEDDFLFFVPPDPDVVGAVGSYGDVISSSFPTAFQPAFHQYPHSNLNMALGEGLIMQAVRGRLSANNAPPLNLYSKTNICNDLITNGHEVPCLPGIENNIAAVENEVDHSAITGGRPTDSFEYPHICVYFGRNRFHPDPPLLTFGEVGSGDGQLYRPWGVCCSKEGNIIVADRSNNRVQVFSGNGEFLLKFGKYGNEPGEFFRPTGVAVNPLGNIAVADKDNHRIQIFTKDGMFLFTFGEKGNNNGQFSYPWDVDVSESGLIVVSDTKNHRIQLFTSDGTFLNKYGFETSTGMWKHFDTPRGVCFGPNGKIIVTDFNNNRLVMIEPNFTQVCFLGNEESNMEQFNRPQGVTVDSEGHIIVADSRNNVIKIFEENGTYVCQFGSFKRKKALLNTPSGISLTPGGQIVVIDFGNNRVQVF
ncbi:hypothetical protein LSTR_LSTR011502 [Laodelphax striatellus]|uniref:B box-type domain-containing protein n=1 Tax=Laodelphax striatellus TaxID=195883 RepID=A0A482WFW2_LAOST|nr:hypothetical protein LSTR_LSTR011502 [Laodelphax striatellus]